jgi:CBS domain containing-hemolysin-like protein
LSQLADWSVAIPLAVLCVAISGFCSGSEVALFSLRRGEREQLSRSDSRFDRRILLLLERPRRLIATVLIGNEAFNSFLAVIALAVVAAHCSFDSPWACAGLALAITLPLVVLVSEVTAKTLAAKGGLTWAHACVYPLSAFAVLITPLRLLVNFAAEVILRPLGESARTRPQRDLSEQEFRSLVETGAAHGQVDARERRLIHRVFEFSDKNVGQVMTPRERIFALSYELPMQRLSKEIAVRGFSRVPIYQKSLDNVRGIVHAKDLVRTPSKPLNDVLHEPLFVPRTTPIKRLFLTFKQKKVHMAIVVSEYGKVLGLVTMDDLLAQIFGVMRDERSELQLSNPGIKLPQNRPRTPAPGVPINEEVTPPAVDVDELRKRGEGN